MYFFHLTSTKIYTQLYDPWRKDSLLPRVRDTYTDSLFNQRREDTNFVPPFLSHDGILQKLMKVVLISKNKLR